METTTKSVEVKTAEKDDLKLIRELACAIFPATYREIVTAEQIDYMMDMFYLPEKLISQFEAGQTFLIIFSEGKAAGFASYSPLHSGGDFKLNKIYLDTRLQGKGLGRILLDAVVQRVIAAGGNALQLNVNKYNKAVGFYRAMGFTVKKKELLDIGNGYFMDDFVLAKIF